MGTQLEKLKQQQEQLKARIQTLEAAEKTRERKKDTSRKILLGSLVLEKLKRGDAIVKPLMAELDGYLTRDHDRALFELPPLSKEDNGKVEKRAEVETA